MQNSLTLVLAVVDTSVCLAPIGIGLFQSMLAPFKAAFLVALSTNYFLFDDSSKPYILPL